MNGRNDGKMPLIQTIGLKKYFHVPQGELHAVDDVNISIYKGKTLGVVGESGCGKSTLGRVLLRLLEATDGQVLYNGENILKYSSHQMHAMRQKMQMIFQDPYASLDQRMSVFQLIAEPLKINKVCKSKGELEDRVMNLMKTVGLAERLKNTYPHELDGGRRQRIGVARALALEPEFIVCDEPVSALDVSIQAQILNLLMDLQDQMGLTYIFITHDLSVVKHIADDICVMYLGQCVEQAPSAELFRNPRHPYTQALLSAIPMPKLGRKKEKRDLIVGELSSPINPKPGCRFAVRCKYEIAGQCHNKHGDFTQLADGHFVMCPYAVEAAGAARKQA